MAASFSTGSFTAPSSAPGPVVLTLGFQLKVLLVWGGVNGYNSAAEEMRYCCGFGRSASPGPHRYMTQQSRWEGLFNKQSSFAEGAGNSSIIFVGGGLNYSSVVDQDFYISAVSSTDVTLTWRTSTGTVKYDYIAIGGSSVTVNNGTQAVATVTGNQSINHGLAATPSLLMTWLGANSNTGAGNCSFLSQGFTDGVNQAVSVTMEGGTTNGVSFSNPGLSKVYQRTDKLIGMIDAAGAVSGEAEFVSWNATNFTVNWTDAPPTAFTLNWLVITGIYCHVGSHNQRTSIGVNSVTGLRTNPLAIINQSVGQATSVVIGANVAMSVGITDGATLQDCIWYGDIDGITATANRRQTRIHRNDGICANHPTGVNSVANDTKGTIAFTVNGFDVDWTVVDGTAREWVFLALGDAPDPGEIDMTMNVGIQLDASAGAITLFADLTGIYTIVLGKTDDSYYDRDHPGQTIDSAIPNPSWKTGYIGG